MSTGQIIRKLRQEKGITMKELGELVGVTEQAISQYERDKRKPSNEMLKKLLLVLNFKALKENDINESISSTLQYILSCLEEFEETTNCSLDLLSYITLDELLSFKSDTFAFIGRLATNRKELNQDLLESDIIFKIEKNNNI